MGKSFPLILVPALTLSATLASSVSSYAQSPGILEAAPSVGHSGDVIYLSGSGYAPHQHLYVMMACPNWHDPRTMEFGNIKFQQDGPVTGDDGTFRAFPFQSLILRHYLSLGCTIYTQYGLSAYGPAFPASYTLVQPGQPLPSGWKRVKVDPSPQRVKSGSTEKIRIASWNGATADVVVTYAGTKFEVHNLSLDLRGNAVAYVPVTLHQATSAEARVQVRVRIGAQTTRGSGRFTIVR